QYSGLGRDLDNGHGLKHGLGSRRVGEPMARKIGKNTEKARKLVEGRAYELVEASDYFKKAHFVKFDETVELVVNLGVDPKHSDQMVRGTVVLPHGLGKTTRVLVIATG